VSERQRTGVFNRLLRTCALLLWTSAVAAAQSWDLNILPLDQIKPGMQGVGKTVFTGEGAEEFGVQVLDIIRNFYPQTDLILVRLTGDRVEQTGVVSGMSGSPVYLDGKLIGAVAVRFGEFAKEPIAGVMPIGYMLEVADTERTRPQAVRSAFSGEYGFMRNVLVGADANFWPTLAQTWSGRAMNQQSRIESPLVFSGFTDAVLAQAAPLMRTLGFQLVSGGGATAANFQAHGKLEPGSSVSQVFISGDLSIDVTGTVTAVDRNRILAFGHHIFNLGPTRLPMASSRVLTTLSSLMGSNKMASSQDIIGSMRQDRLAGVYGELGTAPAQVPVVVQTHSAAQGRRAFSLYLADDPALNNLMPLFLRIAVFQCLVVAQLAAAPCSVQLEGAVDLADGSRITVEDFFSAEQSLGFMAAGSELGDASDLIASLLGALWVSDFASPAVSRITLSANIAEGERYARIHSVTPDRAEVNPGDSVAVAIELAHHDGRITTIRQSLAVPKTTTSSSLTVLVGGGRALTQYDVQTNPEKFRPKNYNELKELLKGRRRNDRLYVQWRVPAPGLIVGGEELADLPPSVMGIMNHRRVSEDRPLRDRLLEERVLPQDREIAGFKRVVFRIIPAGGDPSRRETGIEAAGEW